MSLALIAGVGPGLGLALVERFASAGMAVVASARNRERLNELLARSAAKEAKAIACDVAAPDEVARLFAEATAIDTPEVVVFNAGAFVPGSILDIAPEVFEHCWRTGCLGGFLVGQLAARAMVDRGRGTILFTGATASLRGSARFTNLAVPKFGLRALAQSMARELGPRGIHVAHVVIDGQIGVSSDAQLSPAAIAETYYQLAMQPKSAWTLEVDLRPSAEKF